MTQIEQLHRAYCESTGFDLRMAYDREAAWYRFIKAGFTEANLRLVVAHLIEGVKKGDRREGCLKFHNVVEQIDFFEEELQLAKAAARNFVKPEPKRKALAVLRPAFEPENPGRTRPVAEVIAAMRRAAS